MANIGRIVSYYLDRARRIFERRVGLTEASVFSLVGQILVCECTRDEIVLFNIENRSVYLLNHTAAAVIRLTDGTRNLGWIARKVAWDLVRRQNVSPGT